MIRRWRNRSLVSFLLVAGLLCGAAPLVLGLAACGGNPPPVDPDTAAHLLCLATCKAPGSCQKVEGAWSCVTPLPPNDPCQGKTPRCLAQGDTDCWAVNVSGVCQFWPKQPPPPPEDPCQGKAPLCSSSVLSACWKPDAAASACVFVPAQPPPVQGCPAVCPDDAKTISAKCAQLQCDAEGNCKCTTDSSPRCGDVGNGQPYCSVVTGDPGITKCKATPEGSGLKGCDAQFLGTNCPIWQGSIGPNGPWSRALPDGIDENGNPREGGTPISIDHLDGWKEADGPYTGPCEHATFGLHAPITGFGGVIHGGPNAFARACNKDGTLCSNPVGPINF